MVLIEIAILITLVQVLLIQRRCIIVVVAHMVMLMAFFKAAYLMAITAEAEAGFLAKKLPQVAPELLRSIINEWEAFMALINLNGKYIKLYEDGRYEMYTSEAARKKLKESTPGKVILNKYEELIADLEKPEQAEFRYYDPEGFAAIYDPLVQEYRDYQYNFDNYITGQEYPIMAEYYPDVADSIPELVVAARISQLGESLEESYIKAKQVKRFGETTDA
jgi:hypothetical protein